VYWIAYVTLGLAVGAIIGYLKGHKQGTEEGREWERAMQVERHKTRGFKAAETRRNRKVAP